MLARRSHPFTLRFRRRALHAKSASFVLSNFQIHPSRPSISIPTIFSRLQTPFPASALFSHLYKTPGVEVGASVSAFSYQTCRRSDFPTCRPVDRPCRPLSFHHLTSCPPATPFLSQPSALPGGGVPLADFASHKSPSTSHGFRVSSFDFRRKDLQTCGPPLEPQDDEFQLCLRSSEGTTIKMMGMLLSVLRSLAFVRSRFGYGETRCAGRHENTTAGTVA